MKKGILLITASFCFIVVFLLSSGENAHSYSSQPPAFNASAPGQGSCGAGGLGCHNTNALNAGMGSTTIDFNGGNTSYTAGQTYTVNVTVSQIGAARFGFQLVAFDASDASTGAFIITDAVGTSTQSSGGVDFVNHLNATSMMDSKTFSFDWTAPSTGTGDVNFYVSGNAANGVGSSGDFIYSNQLTISEAVVAPSDFEISAKVYLEAMWNGTSMTTARNTNGLLPSSQPFATYFGYTGTEMVSSFPVDAVDWILLSLKDGNDMLVAQKAGLLLSDGTITDETGSASIAFSGIDNSMTHTLLLHHQSHLGISSSMMLSSGTMYDFTTAATQAAGVEQQKMVNGSYAMYSGDYDSNGNINNLDFNLWANNSAAVNQYLNYDADGNGIVNNLDYNSWELNRSKVGDPSAGL